VTANPSRALKQKGAVFRFRFAKVRLKGNPSSFRALTPYVPPFRRNRLRPTLKHEGKNLKLGLTNRMQRVK